MTIQEAKELDIVLYLQVQDIYPAIISGHQYWYYSPFRQKWTASFKVNNLLNLWLDFGENKGGTPIDLGIRLKNCCVKDFLGSLHGSHQRVEAFSFQQPSPGIQIPGTYTVSSNLLADYLYKRNISIDISDKYLRELKYQKRGEICFALSFKNGLGGYELRSFFSKGSTSPKCGTFININAAFISVFEGFLVSVPISLAEGQKAHLMQII